MKLYHIDINWPSNIPTEIEGNYVPTRHALDRAQEKGIELPSHIKGKCFEVAIEGNQIIKVAVRCKYNNTHDLCIVLSNRGDCITMWLNHVSDTHKTLDYSKYVK